MDTLKYFTGTLVLAGAGKMGGALLQGWLAHGLDPARVAVIEPHPSHEIVELKSRGTKVNPTLSSIGSVDVLVVAVKPQVFDKVAPLLRVVVSRDTLVVSIMAGIPAKKIQTELGGAVIRAMPNLPAAIGRGIIVAVAPQTVSSKQQELAHALLRASGPAEWIDDEALMDAVTAVSGSGPAYVFLLAEELAKAGVAVGLPEELAARLARETVSGAGELLHRSEQDATTLRQNVTSPGGTTAAALAVLMAADGFAPLLKSAVAEATRRSKELAR